MIQLICNHCGEIVDTREFETKHDLVKFIVEAVVNAKTTLDIGIKIKDYIKANPDLFDNYVKLQR